MNSNFNLLGKFIEEEDLVKVITARSKTIRKRLVQQEGWHWEWVIILMYLSLSIGRYVEELSKDNIHLALVL